MDDRDKSKEQLIGELKKLRRSEAQYRRMLDEMSDGYVVTQDKRVVFANQAAARMVGYSAEELIGRPWKEFLKPEVADFLDETPMADLPPLMTADIVRSDGSQITVEFAVRPAQYAGQLAEFALLRDVTEREKAQEILRQERNFVSAVLDTAGALVIVLDEQGRIVRFNRTCERVSGYTFQEVQGKQVWDLFLAPEEVEPVKTAFENLLNGEYPNQFENYWVTRDGRRRLIAWSNTVILDKQGELDYLVGTGIDITERKRAERDIRRRNRELAVLNRVIAAAASTSDVTQVLQVACQELARTLELPQAAAALLNAERDKLDVVAEYLTPGRPSGLGETIPVDGNPATQYVLRHKAPLVVADAQTDERLMPIHQLMRERGTASLMIVPLMVGEQVVGTLGLDAIERREFNAAEVALAQNVATAAGPALERAQLHQALQRHAERLETLLEIDHAILAAQSPQEIAQAAMRHIRQLVPCHRISFTLFDFERREANVLAVYTDGETQISKEMRFPLEDFEIPDPLWQNRVHRVEDVLDRPESSAVNRVLQSEGLRSYINVPLMAKGELIGSLNLGSQSPHTFAPEYIEIAREAAAQLAVAIRQAGLQEELQRHTENLETLVKERTEELQAALERAKSADRFKSEFVSNVSHELRTPLTNLKLYLGLLARGRSEKRETYLDTLRREADRLQNLIDDLLDLSRLDLGKTQLHLQLIDLNLLVSTLVSDRSAMAADDGLTLEVNLDDGLPLTLADPRLIDQVLTNLLTNAVNYTPAGGEVTLRTQKVEAHGQVWTTVSVSDTGPGISQQDQAHLFERFYRGEAGRASEAPGTGLGLAISKEIVDLHKGQITVHSEGVPGRGSEITVWLAAAEQTPSQDPSP